MGSSLLLHNLKSKAEDLDSDKITVRKVCSLYIHTFTFLIRTFEFFFPQKAFESVRDLLNNDKLIIALNNDSKYGSNESTYTWNDLWNTAYR